MRNYRRAKSVLIILPFVLLLFACSTFAQQISEEARRYMVRGVAAIEMAKSQADYVLALQEFQQAAKLAPDYPNVHYNLGNIQSKLNDLTSAIKSFQRYLELAPKSPEAAKVREEIYKLEYRRDRQQLEATLSGKWSTPNGRTYHIALDGIRIQIKRDEQQDDDVMTFKSLGKEYPQSMNIPLIFLGVMSGNRISGGYISPAGNYGAWKNCNVPERKGSFEGAFDAAGGQIRITYDRVELEYKAEFKSFLSDQIVCRQTNRRDHPGYVLELKRDK